MSKNKKRRILICDDEQDYANMLESLFRSSFDVSLASSVKKAIEKIKADRARAPDERYSTIIIDLGFKTSSGIVNKDAGFEILDEAIKDSFVEAIIHTGMGNEERAYKAIRKGAFAYVPKNLDSHNQSSIQDEVFAAVSSHVALLGLVAAIDNLSADSQAVTALLHARNAFECIQRIRRRNSS